MPPQNEKDQHVCVEGYSWPILNGVSASSCLYRHYARLWGTAATLPVDCSKSYHCTLIMWAFFCLGAPYCWSYGICAFVKVLVYKIELVLWMYHTIFVFLCLEIWTLVVSMMYVHYVVLVILLSLCWASDNCLLVTKPVVMVLILDKPFATILVT